MPKYESCRCLARKVTHTLTLNRDGRRVKVTYSRCENCRYEKEIDAVELGAATKSDYTVDSSDATTWLPPHDDDAFSPMPGGEPNAADADRDREHDAGIPPPSNLKKRKKGEL